MEFFNTSGCAAAEKKRQLKHLENSLSKFDQSVECRTCPHFRTMTFSHGFCKNDVKHYPKSKEACFKHPQYDTELAKKRWSLIEKYKYVEQLNLEL